MRVKGGTKNQTDLPVSFLTSNVTLNFKYKMFKVDREWKKNYSIRACNKLTGAQQFRVMTEAACLVQYVVLTYSNY